MKRIVPLVTACLLATAAFSQTPAPRVWVPKKKMLGVYNTSSFHIMPRTQPATPYYYDFGPIYPSYSESRMGYSFRNTTGYRFFDALALGLGVGVDNFESSALQLPFFMEITGNILPKRFTPIYYVQGGYGLGINLAKKNPDENPNQYQRQTKTDGGLMAAGGIGFGGRLDQNTILRVNFGYRFQRASFTNEVKMWNSAPYLEVRHMTYHRIEIGISFTFQQ